MAKSQIQNMTLKKKALLEALEKSLGVVTTACKEVGISRNTHYEWMKDDPEYKQAVESMDDVVLDFAESALYGRVKAGDTTAIIFYLKCKGKKRGYRERTEIEQTNITQDVDIEQIKKEIRELVADNGFS
jgi:hypothetical protein